MDATASAQLDHMALTAKDGLGVAVLRKAMDAQTSSVAALLQTMPSAPQAENKGTLVDVQA